MDRLRLTPDPAGPRDLTLSADLKLYIEDAAASAQVDPCHLLGLLLTQSGTLSPVAERWGSYKLDAIRSMIDNYYRGLPDSKRQLQDVIDQAWPDIRFGRSQTRVADHPDFLETDPRDRYTPETFGRFNGDAASAVAHADAVLAVRSWAFNHQAEDAQLAATHLSACFRHPTCDGTPVSAVLIYNAGEDHRDDAAWRMKWHEEVLHYRECLATAERYRQKGPDPVLVAQTLARIWGMAGLLEAFAPERAEELHNYVLVLKLEFNALGGQLP